jgi:hypothetical protein
VLHLEHECTTLLQNSRNYPMAQHHVPEDLNPKQWRKYFIMFPALASHIRIMLKRLQISLMKTLSFVENYKHVCHSHGQYMNFYSQVGKSYRSSLAEALPYLDFLTLDP